MLILDKPGGIGRIWDNLVLVIRVLGGDGFGGLGGSLIYVAIEAGAHDLGSGLSTPQYVVCAGEGFRCIVV